MYGRFSYNWRWWQAAPAGRIRTIPLSVPFKERLIGAAVLVALAVIFLPMILDGAGTREIRDEELAMPERPETPEPDLDASSSAQQAADQSQAPAREEAEPEQAAPTEASDPPDPLAGSEAPAGDDGEGDAEAAVEPESPDAEDPSPDADPDAVKTWAVQTGSFTREANAQEQRDRLQEEGFDAFIESAEADDTAMWRVRVGPMAMENDARTVLERLQSEHGFEPILVSHP